MNTLDFPRKSLPSPKEILVRAFPGINQWEIQELLQSGQVQTYPAGTVLTHEGKVESKFYILLEGRVNVTKTINNIEQRHLKELEAGDFFGEMALIHNAPRAATVTAVEPVTVMEIDREDFERVLRHSSSVAIAMVREISTRLRENDEMAIEDLRIRASELAQAYQKLAEQELARREFLSNIAHQLRTPLMAAGGFLQLIQNGLITPDKLPGTLQAVARNIAQITALVNDILFLQEMDLILPKFQPVRIQEIVQNVVEAFQEKAAAHLVTLQVESEPDLPAVSGDPKTLERALSALVDNAIKFSPNGGPVTIRVQKDPNTVIISVSDHGIGIEKERLPHIFDRFYHLEQSGEHLFSGLGLGLAITQQVIKQHNGQLTVESEPGKGSTFSIHLKAIKVVF
ncbi:MAG: ATP-binding protein [Anaerolineales bacterium]|nr:ATP-binding protein [Anaerolineales bacterium]